MLKAVYIMLTPIFLAAYLIGTESINSLLLLYNTNLISRI